MNRLSSNSASTPSAALGPIGSMFNAPAAWRIAREARSRTDEATPGRVTSSRRVAIAVEARDRTSARSRSLQNDLARFNDAMNAGSSRDYTAAVSRVVPAASAPCDRPTHSRSGRPQSSEPRPTTSRAGRCSAIPRFCRDTWPGTRACQTCRGRRLTHSAGRHLAHIFCGRKEPDSQSDLFDATPFRRPLSP
jgi:hypothetical protein